MNDDDNDDGHNDTNDSDDDDHLRYPVLELGHELATELVLVVDKAGEHLTVWKQEDMLLRKIAIGFRQDL